MDTKSDRYDADDMDHMIRISKLIADMQKIHDQYGDTCIYIRRGGLSWGAVALNRRADDEKNGVFDLQAEHDSDMLRLGARIQRLVAEREAYLEREAAKTESD